MSACTKSPWEKKAGSLRVQTVAEPKIAICYTDTFGTAGEAVGNAHLIAAAPELFEALKNCRTMAIEFGAPAIYWTAQHKEWLASIDAAIAKAGGK